MFFEQKGQRLAFMWPMTARTSAVAFVRSISHPGWTIIENFDIALLGYIRFCTSNAWKVLENLEGVLPWYSHKTSRYFAVPPTTFAHSPPIFCYLVTSNMCMYAIIDRTSLPGSTIGMLPLLIGLTRIFQLSAQIWREACVWEGILDFDLIKQPTIWKKNDWPKSQQPGAKSVSCREQHLVMQNWMGVSIDCSAFSLFLRPISTTRNMISLAWTKDLIIRGCYNVESIEPRRLMLSLKYSISVVALEVCPVPAWQKNVSWCRLKMEALLEFHVNSFTVGV